MITVYRFLTLFLALSLISSTTDKELEWMTNYNDALTLSKKSEKNILIYFTGSDWCAPCIQLKKDLFDQKEFKNLAENYVLLYIDMPRKNDVITVEQKAHNKEVFLKFNKTGVFPLFLALSPKGKILDEYSGYSMNGEIGYHLDFLKRNK